MTTKITLNLPDKVYRRIQRLAELAGRDVEATIMETLDGHLPPLSSELDSQPVETLTDQEILTLSESMMDEALSVRMSMLSHKQQMGSINLAERAELHMLLEIFETGQIRRTQALIEAVRRGLIEPPHS